MIRKEKRATELNVLPAVAQFRTVEKPRNVTAVRSFRLRNADSGAFERILFAASFVRTLAFARIALGVDRQLGDAQMFCSSRLSHRVCQSHFHSTWITWQPGEA